MAHILIYAQRTPTGIHPGSIISLCLARDIGSQRGASITAVCPGDGGDHDEIVAAAVGRYGSDSLTFIGERGIEELVDRLQPISILVPYTAEGLAAVASLPDARPEPRWLRKADHGWGSADPITAMIAGCLPWYDLETVLDPEYQKNCDAIALPDWVAADKKSSDRDRRQIVYVVAEHLGEIDAETRAALRSLGARPAPSQQIEQHDGGTLLLLGAPEGGLPESLDRKAADARVVFLPGETARFHKSWARADWVLPGPWPEPLRDLHSEMWKKLLS
ncbi:MAG: hypothetical protein KC636_33760 [Myxococcales bacterium]|nr:hypothetical protein [Myxococcales bacterium]